MKLRLICLLLAGAFFPLAAQTAQTVSVYMPTFTGTGIDEQDGAFYFMYIYREIEARDNITMGRASSSTDYTLLGAISPGADRTFYFNLNVYDNITGDRISEQRYRYSSLSNAEVALKTMLDNIFTLILPVQPVEPPPSSAQQPVLPAQIPARPVTPPAQQPAQPAQPPDEPAPPPVLPDRIPVQPPDEPAQPPVKPSPNEDWRDRWLFLGISAAWAPRIYDDEERQASNLRNFGLGFYPELQFLDSVALGTGLGLTPEWIVVGDDKGEGENYRDMILAVPLLLKIVLKPGDNLMLEPYSGISLNFPLFGVTKPPQLSWVVGYQHSVKTGPGAFFFDFRFFMDIGKSTLEERPPLPKQEYQRYGLEISAGYKFGVIQK